LAVRGRKRSAFGLAAWIRRRRVGSPGSGDDAAVEQAVGAADLTFVAKAWRKVLAAVLSILPSLRGPGGPASCAVRPPAGDAPGGGGGGGGGGTVDLLFVQDVDIVHPSLFLVGPPGPPPDVVGQARRGEGAACRTGSTCPGSPLSAPRRGSGPGRRCSTGRFGMIPCIVGGSAIEDRRTAAEVETRPGNDRRDLSCRRIAGGRADVWPGSHCRRGPWESSRLIVGDLVLPACCRASSRRASRRSPRSVDWRRAEVGPCRGRPRIGCQGGGALLLLPLLLPAAAAVVLPPPRAGHAKGKGGQSAAADAKKRTFAKGFPPQEREQKGGGWAPDCRGRGTDATKRATGADLRYNAPMKGPQGRSPPVGARSRTAGWTGRYHGARHGASVARGTRAESGR